MKAHPVTWAARLLWLVIPFTTGDALGRALATHSRPVQVTVTIGAWALWAALAIALLIPAPATLTVVRIGVPAAALVASWATWRSDGTATGVAGLVVALVAGALAITGYVGDDFVDGASYGDERRFTLRAPAVLLLGPIPLAWLAVVTGTVAGPLLLAARQWVAGAVAIAAGGILVWFGSRSLHTLATRFAVFVPAGFTLVDPLTLVDSILFPVRRIISFGPALADAEGERLDLSQQALGLALELGLDSPVELTVKRARRRAEDVRASRILLNPARPAAVIAEARRRNIG